jgi:hypothetical protein
MVIPTQHLARYHHGLDRFIEEGRLLEIRQPPSR